MILRCYDGEAQLYNGGYERPFKCHLTAAEPEQNVNTQHTCAHAHTHTHAHAHTHTFHRRNAFYTVQTILSIGLHQTYPLQKTFYIFTFSKKLILYDL